MRSPLLPFFEMKDPATPITPSGQPLRRIASRISMMLVFMALPSLLLSQSINGRLTTSFMSWQTHDSAGATYNHARGFQGAQCDVRYSDFSLSSYFQASNDFSNRLAQDALVRFYNLYAKWRNIGGIGELSVGRLPVFAGVGDGIIDGALGKATLMNGMVGVTAYYGGLLPDNQKLKLISNFSNNAMMGAQAIVLPAPSLRIGVSYMNKTEKQASYQTTRISDQTTIPFTVDYAAQAEQYVSGDVSYRNGTLYSLYGRYDYDLNLDRNGRIEIDGRLSATDRVGITADYVHRVPHVAANSIFSVFDFSSSDEIEGGVTYSFTPTAQAYVRFGNVQYSDSHSQRLTLGGRWLYFEGGYSKNLGFAGDLDGFHLYAAVPILDSRFTGTCGIDYSSYRLSDVSERDKTLSGVLGLSYRPITALSFDLQGQYVNNKIYKSDGRLFFRLNYWFFNQL